MFTQTFRFAIHYTLTVSIIIQPKDESGTVVSPIWLKIIPTRFMRNSPKLQFLNLPMLGRDFLSSEFVFYISLIYI